MSTKIYNGYRLSGLTGVADLFAFTGQLRAALDPVYRAAYVHQIARIAVIAADMLERGETPDTGPVETLTNARSPLMYADHALNDAHQTIATTKRRNPDLDLQFELTVLTDPANPGTLYALAYTEQDGYRTVFEELSEVRPWPYWNNTDRPNDVTDAEWELRRDTWQRVLGDEPPGRRGLSWALLGDDHALSTFELTDEISAVLPTLRSVRARSIAGRQATNWSPEDGVDALLSEVTERARQIESQLREWTVDELWMLPAF
jgi:hypothetical protein